MAKQISNTKIELLKNCWHEGKSLPHCAMVAGVSKATAKKYLANEIRHFVEHKSAKPIKPANEPEPIDAISELSLNQFRQYAEQSFAEIGKDQLALKQMFYELQNEYKTDYNKLIVLRECYDDVLSQLSKNRLKPSANSELGSNRLKSIRDTIKAYASRYQCKIPGRRKSVYETWGETELLQHLCYHIARNKCKMKHTEIMALLDSLSDEALLKDWLDEVLKQT